MNFISANDLEGNYINCLMVTNENIEGRWHLVDNINGKYEDNQNSNYIFSNLAIKL